MPLVQMILRQKVKCTGFVCDVDRYQGSQLAPKLGRSIFDLKVQIRAVLRDDTRQNSLSC